MTSHLSQLLGPAEGKEAKRKHLRVGKNRCDHRRAIMGPMQNKAEACNLYLTLASSSWQLWSWRNTHGCAEIALSITTKMFGQGECISRYYITQMGNGKWKQAIFFWAFRGRPIPYGFNIGTLTNAIQLKSWNTDIFSSSVKQIQIPGQPCVLLRGAHAVMSQ